MEFLAEFPINQPLQPKVRKRKPKSKSEKDQVNEYTKDFIPEESQAYKVLQAWGLEKKNYSTFKGIAQVISFNCHIELPHICKKYWKPLLKWYDDNFDIVFPAMSKMVLIFSKY